MGVVTDDTRSFFFSDMLLVKFLESILLIDDLVLNVAKPTRGIVAVTGAVRIAVINDVLALEHGQIGRPVRFVAMAATIGPKFGVVRGPDEYALVEPGSRGCSREGDAGGRRSIVASQTESLSASGPWDPGIRIGQHCVRADRVRVVAVYALDP